MWKQYHGRNGTELQNNKPVKGKEEQRLGLILISVQADIVAILGRIWKR